jgi:hypothetical protein
MAVHQVAAGEQMLVVGPARVDIKGATYEEHFKVKPFSLPKAPTLTSLTPNTAVIGDPMVTMEVRGTDFIEESVIVFNGGEEATTFVDKTKLTTGVNPETASVPGSYPVLVRTFSHETEPQFFSFTEAGAQGTRRTGPMKR